MVTIDLAPGPRRPAAEHLLAGLPRRVALTLPELRLTAALAGDAPLPFTTRVPRPGQPLGATTADGHAEATAHAAALNALSPAGLSLSRRGLLGTETDGRTSLDPGIGGALGLLATGTLALEVDVAVGPTRIHSWQRQVGGAVATLATADGLVFELAWFGFEHWRDELSRLVALPEEVALGESQVPPRVTAPFHLVTSVGEGLRQGRQDLVDVLVAGHEHPVRTDDEPLEPEAGAQVLRAFHQETRGRLRVLAIRSDGASAGEASPSGTVGIVSWLLLADGWHAVTPRADAHVAITAVTPEELGAAIGAVIEEART